MKKYYWVPLLCIALAYCGGCSMVNKKMGLEDDNIFESAIEDVIESYSGIDIDLTPENPDEDGRE